MLTGTKLVDALAAMRARHTGESGHVVLAYGRARDAGPRGTRRVVGWRPCTQTCTCSPAPWHELV